MSRELKQQLFIQFLGAFFSVLLVTGAGLFTWYTVVNVEIALLNQSIKEHGKKVERLTSKLESADIGGMKAVIQNHENRLNRIEIKLDK